MRNIFKKISEYIPSPGGRARMGVLFLLLPFTFYAQTNIFPASGNVGIGTSNPNRKLDVVGDIKSDTRIIVSNPESPASSVQLGWWNNVARIRVGGSGNGAGNGVDIQTQGDKSLMRLLHNGNVGIGTTSPDSKLSVNGVIHSKEVKVDLSGWSDFVFDEDYDLSTLKEVEEHIREKGHLQDIPGAKEVEQNGIFLGEMDAKLLQKIEELTLYTIQQQKVMEEQGKMINELKEKLEKLTD